MKIIVAIAFYFLYWGVCFLGTGTDKKISWGCVLIPKKFKPCAKRPSAWKGCSEEEIHRCVWLSNLLLFTVVFSALGLALRGVLNLDGYLSAFWYFLAFSEGLGLFDLLVIDLLWWRNTKRTRFSSCRRRNTIKIRKSISNRFGAVSRCLPQLPHWQP